MTKMILHLAYVAGLLNVHVYIFMCTIRAEIYGDPTYAKFKRVYCKMFWNRMSESLFLVGDDKTNKLLNGMMFSFQAK